jgi:signal peptidase II
LKATLKAYFWLVLIAGVVVALDQWTKALVRAKLDFGQAVIPWDWLAPYVAVVRQNNTGIAFGMFQGNNLLFSVLAVIVSAAIIYYYPQLTNKDGLLTFAMGLILGGAVGNLIDRVTIGRVTDFIAVSHFAVFNLADASLSCGVALLLLGMWLRQKQANL